MSPGLSPAPRYQPLFTTPPQASTLAMPTQNMQMSFTPRAKQIKDAQQQPPPDTPTNRARVDRLREEWLMANPKGLEHAGSDYPLTPGTAAAGTDACSRCGKPETETHNMFWCWNEPLEMREQQYRCNVYTKGRFNWISGIPGSPTPLFHIGMEMGEKKEIGEEELWMILENSKEEKGGEVEI
ncbi:hypothetical protein K439DRAFT_1621232 [Ramaria rubella]|nr:hypothetical protein K439DRAFT_1621232 [Ramaria rubella]